MQQKVIRAASFLTVKKAYEDARAPIYYGALMAAIGIIAFAWGATPPSMESENPLAKAAAKNSAIPALRTADQDD